MRSEKTVIAVLRYHLVLVTKFRHRAINEDVFNTISETIQRIFASNGCEIITLNYDYNHIHMLFTAPPQIQSSSMISNLKTVTSRMVRRDHAAWLRRFYWKPFFWSRSYFISSVGDVTTAIVDAYIQSQ